MISDINKQKRDLLIKQGWVESKPEFDWDYFQNVSSKNLGRDLGHYISKVTNKIGENWFNVLGEEVESAGKELYSKVCPPAYVPQPPPATAYISATWPFNPSDYSSNMEAAFEELTYRVIIRIVEHLGTPDSVHQTIGQDESVVMVLDPNSFDIKDITIFGKLIIKWGNTYATANKTHSWNDNGAITAYCWDLYSENLRELAADVLYNVGLELNPTSYQLGDLEAEFALETFPQYIRDLQAETSQEMFFPDGRKCLTYPERFNTLIVGPPGYGKTRWSQAFATEVLAPLGYLVLVIDYSTLRDLVIPNYIGKVCIIVNDADTLALTREEAQRGETEQVLSWLDGTRTSFIKPFYLEKRTSVVTIMTANSVKKWDPAALRKGRVHKTLAFDKVKLSDV